MKKDSEETVSRRGNPKGQQIDLEKMSPNSLAIKKCTLHPQWPAIISAISMCVSVGLYAMLWLLSMFPMNIG